MLFSGSRSCPNEASEYGEPKEIKLHNSIVKAHEKIPSKKESALRRASTRKVSN